MLAILTPASRGANRDEEAFTVGSAVLSIVDLIIFEVYKEGMGERWWTYHERGEWKGRLHA